jgi:hypothetical protein
VKCCTTTVNMLRICYIEWCHAVEHVCADWCARMYILILGVEHWCTSSKTGLRYCHQTYTYTFKQCSVVLLLSDSCCSTVRYAIITTQTYRLRYCAVHIGIAHVYAGSWCYATSCCTDCLCQRRCLLFCVLPCPLTLLTFCCLCALCCLIQL